MNTCENKPEGNYCWKISCKKWDTCSDRRQPSLIACIEWVGVVRAQDSYHPFSMVLDNGTIISFIGEDGVHYTSCSIGADDEPDPYLRD